MIETSKKVVEATNELWGLIASDNMACLSDMGSMDETTFMTMRAVAKFMNACNDLIMEQAAIIEEMNKKLDILTKQRKS